MAVINDPNVAANIGRVGEVASGAIGAQHNVLKPIPASIGHYRVNHRFVMVNAQAANSRLFELRNAHASNLIVLTRLEVKWISTAAHTAFIEDSIDFFKLTGFSVASTTGKVDLVPSLKRTSMVATSALIKGVTIAGAAAGMTGFTSVKDTSACGQFPRILPTAVMAATETAPRVGDNWDFVDDVNGTHPWVFALNEGFLLENRVVLGAAAGSSVYIDCSYAEVAAY